MSFASLFLVVLVVVVHSTNSARILSIFHTPSKSHQLLAQQLLFDLASTGHHVTMVSPFPVKPSSQSSQKNFRHIHLAGVETYYDYFWENAFVLLDDTPMKMLEDFMIETRDLTNLTLTHPNVRKLLESKDEHFDLLYIEGFLNDAFLGFAHHFNCPAVVMSTIGMTMWANDQVANPAPLSFVPDGLLPYSTRMTLYERFINFGWSLFERYLNNMQHYPNQEQLYQNTFPNPKPTLKHLRQTKVALVLLNSHFTLDIPRPFFPNMIEVGGMQINTNPDRLPEDIRNFIEAAPDGVVYFSLGGNLWPSRMAPQHKEAIFRALGKIKQRVIWKWDDESFNPDNEKFMIRKWLPQDAILAHPNVRLFITHGGLLSCTESIYFGKPMVGTPIFGDQMTNMAKVAAKGWGINLNYHNITEGALDWALNEVLTNSVYTETVQATSKVFRDQPLTPLETAKYWVEYVLRHKGAHHIKSAAPELSFVVYYNLDLYGIILAMFVVLLAVPVFIVKLLSGKLRDGNNNVASSKIKMN